MTDAKSMVKQDQEVIKHHNKQMVLEVIRTRRPIARSEISKVTGMSATSVGRIVAELCEEGLVKETSLTSGGVGLDYAVNERLTLRAGVQYDPTPTPDDERTARVPDGDRWIFGAGASARLNERTTLDLAGAYIHFEDSTVFHDTEFYPGTPAAVTTRLRGDVQGTGYLMSAGLRMSF